RHTRSKRDWSSDVCSSDLVLETRSIPETFTAMLEFDEDKDIEENIENMAESIEDMHTVEVSISIRDTSVNNIEIKKDDYIGILEIGRASCREREESRRVRV